MSSIQSVIGTTTNIESLVSTNEYERIGSLVFWEFPNKSTIKHDVKAIKEVFANTELEKYIQPVGLSECIRRFAESTTLQHGTLYGKPLNYLIEKDKNNPGFYFLVFYTGKVDDKKNTNFTEHCKVWIGDDGNYLALLDKDNNFLIQDILELQSEFNQHWVITHKDIMSALGLFANEFGYRFNSHGGHYFIPHKFTDELYKIKRLLSQFNQIFSITPLIAGCEEDIEEVINLLGKEFKKELEQAEKALFEQCIQLYNFQHHWDDYVDAVHHKAFAEVKANKISKTKYGRKLTDKILKVAENSGNAEYQSIIKEYLSGIKPNKNKSIVKIYGIRDQLKSAVTKLNISTESKLLNKWRNRLLEDLYQVNDTLQKTSELLVDEVLSIL